MMVKGTPWHDQLLKNFIESRKFTIHWLYINATFTNPPEGFYEMIDCDKYKYVPVNEENNQTKRKA